MHDGRDMTLRQHRTTSAGLRLGDEGDICAALVGARATVGTLTAVVAAGPALPGFGKDCQGIWQPAHAQPSTSAADALVGVAMRVGWQRIGPAARTMAIMPWAGNTDQVLCLDVETFQFTVGNRPVSADTEAAGHAHRHRMEAVLHRRNAGCCPPRTGRAGISMPAECRRQPGRDYGPTIAVAPTVSSGPAAARRCTRGGIPSPQERNTAPSSAGAAGFHGPGHNRTRTPEPECLHRGWPEPMRKLCYRRRR